MLNKLFKSGRKNNESSSTAIAGRYRLIDSLRGLAVVNMVIFHLLYDIFVIYRSDYKWALHPAVYAWERYICFSFIIISGVSLHFTSHPYRRGIIVSLCGLAVTAVTALAVPSQIVWFGVLNLIGAAMIITAFAKPLLVRIPPFVGAVFSLILYALTCAIPKGYIGFFYIRLFSLPKKLYDIGVLVLAGFPPKDFHSSDYFPLLPWIFVFLFGFFLWEEISRRKAEGLFVRGIPGLEVIGKYSLLMYLVHQPIIMGCLELIF